MHSNSLKLSDDPSEELNYTALAVDTEGYMPTDLSDLVARAIHHAVMRGLDSTDDDQSVVSVDHWRT